MTKGKFTGKELRDKYGKNKVNWRQHPEAEKRLQEL